MFTVDALLYTMGTDFTRVNGNLQTDITNVHGWYANNKLAVNVKKPKSNLSISGDKHKCTKNDQKLNITLNGHNLDQNKSMYYLCVDVDEKLT